MIKLVLFAISLILYSLGSLNTNKIDESVSVPSEYQAEKNSEIDLEIDDSDNSIEDNINQEIGDDDSYNDNKELDNHLGNDSVVLPSRIEDIPDWADEDIAENEEPNGTYVGPYVIDNFDVLFETATPISTLSRLYDEVNLFAENNDLADYERLYVDSEIYQTDSEVRFYMKFDGTDTMIECTVNRRTGMAQYKVCTDKTPLQH